jgi:hypothetical protein
MRTEIERDRSGCRGRVASAAGLVTAMALTLLLWDAPSASAGGPTSVLVVAPATSEAAGLTYSDKRYDELERLLGRPGVGSLTKAPETDLAGARQINVTWLLHDVDPWRLNQVYVDTDSTAVWIHTATDLPQSRNGYWHRAGQPAALRALLTELGVMGRSLTRTAAQAGTAEPGAGPGLSPAEAAAASPSPDGDSGWSRATAGLAAGLALGAGGSVLIHRAAARREAGPPHGEPRQELIDL